MSLDPGDLPIQGQGQSAQEGPGTLCGGSPLPLPPVTRCRCRCRSRLPPPGPSQASPCSVSGQPGALSPCQASPCPLRAPAPATRSAGPCLAPRLESRWPGGHRGARSRSAHPASPPACTVCFLSPNQQDDTAPLRGGGLRGRLRRHVTTHRAGAQQSPAQSPRGHRAAAGPGPPAPCPEQARHWVSPEASATAAKPLPKALGAPSLRRWRHVSEAAPRAPGSVTFLRGAVSGPANGGHTRLSGHLEVASASGGQRRRTQGRSPPPSARLLQAQPGSRPSRLRAVRLPHR